MKSPLALFLFGLLVFVASTSARPRDSESDLSTYNEERDLGHSIAQDREHIRRQRRRHSRQTSDRQQVDDGSGNSVNQPDEDDDDEGRPVSFKPHNTNNPQGRPSPPVEHGSVQAGLSTEATTTAKPTTRKLPGACEAAILMCCRFPKDAHEGCFKQYGCTMTYKTGLACLPKTLALVIKHFKEAYAPS